MSEIEYKIPFALFNSKALFNPYQYLPFEKIMEWKDGKYVLNGKNLLITDEVGVGKTFEAGIILQELLQNKPDLTVLILCPVKLCSNWVSELAENFYIGAVNYRERKSFGKVTVIPYSAFSGKKAVNEHEERKFESVLINDTESNGDCELIKQFASQLKHYDVLILDEAHYIRNRGKLWNIISQLEECESPETNETVLRIFMTGTPIFNRTEDYNNITELLGDFEVTTTLQGESNCYDYMPEIKFGGLDKDGNPGSFIEWGTEKEIYEKISETITKEVEDPDSEETKEVTRAAYGRRTGIMKQLSSSSFYSLIQWIKSKVDNKSIESDEFEDDIDELLDEEDDLCDEDATEEQNISEILNLDCVKSFGPKEDSKLSALKELLKYLQEQDNAGAFKAIIFSRFHLTCKYLEEQLKGDYAVCMITGNTNVKEFEKIKSYFKDNDKSMILICSDAAKEGHNLQFCHNLIHYDLPFAPAVIGQRNGRIYRKGQQKQPKCFYMLLGHINEEGKGELDGYDERLFGQILDEKCSIVKRASEEKLVSKMNILPEDSESIMMQYLEDSFEVQEGNKPKTDAEKNAIKTARAKWRLLKKYSNYSSRESKEHEDQNNTDDLKWFRQDAKELYEKLKDNTVDADSAIGEIKNMYMEDFKESRNLKDFYTEKYGKILNDFINNHFGNTFAEEKDSAKRFVAACVEYIKESGYSDECSRFCHDVIDGELQNKPIDPDQYRREFEPLIKKKKSGE